MPPGRHGITGYTTRVNGLTEPVNWLTWRGAYSGRDLSEEQPPERIQPEDDSVRAGRAGRGQRDRRVIADVPRQRADPRGACVAGDYVASFTAADTATLVAEARVTGAASSTATARNST